MNTKPYDAFMAASRILLIFEEIPDDCHNGYTLAALDKARAEVERFKSSLDPMVVPKVHHLGVILQFIADYNANVLTPRQIKALYLASEKLWDNDDKPAVFLDRAKIADILFATLADTYDCDRVWSAWSYGTMTADDFQPAQERAGEIADEIISALS